MTSVDAQESSPSPHRADSGDRVRPSLASPRGAFEATVMANRLLCRDHYRLTLALARFPASVPGQFVQLDCRGHAGDSDEPREIEWPPVAGGRLEVGDRDFAAPVVYLRRPFSIADRRESGGEVQIDIIHRVVGRGTGLLARLPVGGKVSLLGPLGVGFGVPADLKCACLVGGGVGIPPMLYLARSLAGSAARRVAFLGAQRGDLLPVSVTGPEPSPSGEPLINVAELTPFDCGAVITTDDGSRGMKGFVTQALRGFLASVPAGERAGTVVYCCGPTPMMKATARVAAEAGVLCQVSLEQPMACGMGTCQSCIIRYRPHEARAETDWKYKLTCTDGPVFDTRDILW